MYKEKYLKYKTKYLDLKNQLGGAPTDVGPVNKPLQRLKINSSYNPNIYSQIFHTPVPSAATPAAAAPAATPATAAPAAASVPAAAASAHDAASAHGTASAHASVPAAAPAHDAASAPAAAPAAASAPAATPASVVATAPVDTPVALATAPAPVAASVAAAHQDTLPTTPDKNVIEFFEQKIENRGSLINIDDSSIKEKVNNLITALYKIKWKTNTTYHNDLIKNEQAFLSHPSIQEILERKKLKPPKSLPIPRPPPEPEPNPNKYKSPILFFDR